MVLQIKKELKSYNKFRVYKLILYIAIILFMTIFRLTKIRIIAYILHIQVRLFCLVVSDISATFLSARMYNAYTAISIKAVT